MGVHAGDAVEELVADGLAGDGGAGGEKLLDHRAMGDGRHGLLEPVRIAGPGALALDGVHVLDDGGEAGERAVRCAWQRTFQIVRDEKAAHALFFCVPRYQSRIFSPLQQATPGFDRISSKARSTYLMRCVCPER